ncbi:hypothetical protein [endosymbiont GvMRE of Glomus versiforme]|uniref:hypothetical protein n=1 Tax=endosymbiont GvMRE of Glomus versiforme TaxID=2039283 RepID=UPI000EBC8C4F|nr:hypothetical protein [endosymbiont GvMRE of Glomus versiforme]RHZ37368.1 hypothetical protein GvMRE_I1g433 [endosymbiont GvMRE of Glomus versiforme]
MDRDKNEDKYDGECDKPELLEPEEPDIEHEPEEQGNFEPSADFCWTHESDCGSECEEWRKEHQE